MPAADPKKKDMSRKKQEIQLQQEIETQEEWEEMMAKEGLWVVDIYQEWCGPCAAMVSNFRRLKNEIGDDLLHFATAKVDTIDALDKYKGKCEPTFLYFACGVLVGVVHGSQSPLIIRTVTEQLAQEHKVIDGASERKAIKDPLVSSQLEKGELDEEETEKDEDTGFTVAIIKPDAVQNGKVEEVLQQMKDKGIEILAEEERQLTEEEAREFYKHLNEQDYFEELVKFMSSGPSHMLVLTKGSSSGESVLTEWRDMIGPTSVEEAKEQAPDSLRAKYGSGKVANALHGSSSPETAAREMAFFFPTLAVPKQKSKSVNVQRTLALIRPDAFKTQKDEIMEKIKQSGFKVALQKTMSLNREQAAEFYKEHKDQDYFEDLVTRMSSGPLMALGLAREDAIQGWREMLGPKEVNKAKEEAPESLRAQFAVENVEINQLHGSDSPETAQKELEFFFPVEQTVACIKPDGLGTKDAIINKIHEAGFRIAAQKETVITKEIAEDFYADHKDKEYFNDLVEHMTSGPTMFMVLSKEDAVSGWRQAIGPTDPEQAKTEIPDSLRAMYGKDVLHNAVHGSSSSDHAKKSIEQVFGHLEFNADGTVKGSKPSLEQEEQAVTQSVPEVSSDAPEVKPDEVENKPEESQETETSPQAESTEQKTEANNEEDTASKSNKGSRAGTPKSRPGSSKSRTGSSKSKTGSGTGSPKPGTESLKPGTESPKPGTESPKPGTESPKPETESSKPKTESPEPRTGSAKSRTESPKSRTESPKPGTGSPIGVKDNDDTEMHKASAEQTRSESPKADQSQSPETQADQSQSAEATQGDQSQSPTQTDQSDVQKADDSVPVESPNQSKQAESESTTNQDEATKPEPTAEEKTAESKEETEAEKPSEPTTAESTEGAIEVKTDSDKPADTPVKNESEA